MYMKILCLTGLLAIPALADDVDYGAAASYISAALSDPSFVPYSKPKQKIEEWIALGDSYTAGTGANGNDEIIAGDAVRGKRAYPMQMSTDSDNWGFVNDNDETLPRFSFHAYTGDTTTELITKQLTPGDYKDDKNLPRGQPFGKPQVAVMTIGGNDATLSTILNDCIYRAWSPGNCQDTLKALQGEIDNGNLQEKINYAMYQAAHTGRTAGGANPIESFQVYVLEYITFFDDGMSPECNDYTWAYWGSWITEQPKLTKELRTQLNDFTVKVNAVIKKAAQDLERMGIVFVEGLNNDYKGHRYCESGSDKEQTTAKTWFWSPYAHFNTPSEGAGDPSNAQVGDILDPAQQLLDFVFPGQNKVAPQSQADSQPPWEWPGAEKYPDILSLMNAVSASADGDVNATVGAPFPLLRSFHPKGTALTQHAKLLFGAMADNREATVTGGGGSGNYSVRCKDWEIDQDHLLVATCTDKDGNGKKSQEDLNLCLHYNNGALIPQDGGDFTADCHGCFFNPVSWNDHSTLWCVCKNSNDPFAKDASIHLDDLMTVQDDGFVQCSGHISALA